MTASTKIEPTPTAIFKTTRGKPVKDIKQALKPYGYEWMVSITGMSGSGSLIVVYAGPGDFYTACLTHDYQVVWVMTCGGQEVEANTDAANELHGTTRDLFRISTNEKKPPAEAGGQIAHGWKRED